MGWGGEGANSRTGGNGRQFPPCARLGYYFQVINWDNQKIISLVSHLSEIIILYSLMSNAEKLAQADNSYNS